MINPSVSTLCFYITHLTTAFSSPKGVRNYVSVDRFLHKQLGMAPDALDTFLVYCLLRAADLTMQTPPLHCVPILPHLLMHLCGLSSYLGSLGSAMEVCLTFSFLGMLRQSNLAPSGSSAFDHTCHTCWGDVLVTPP